MRILRTNELVSFPSNFAKSENACTTEDGRCVVSWSSFFTQSISMTTDTGKPKTTEMFGAVFLPNLLCPDMTNDTSVFETPESSASFACPYSFMLLRNLLMLSSLQYVNIACNSLLTA